MENLQFQTQQHEQQQQQQQQHQQHHQQHQQKQQQRQTNSTPPPQNLSIGTTSSSSSQIKSNKPPQILTIQPPPVPKRNFHPKTVNQEKDNREIASNYRNSKNNYTNSRSLNEHNCRRRRHYSENSEDNDEDNFSISPLSLDDKDKLDDIIIYDRTGTKLVKSNQSSSSDSNKSQNTIDTGYMSSSNDIDRQPIFTIGHHNQEPTFRNRFSSEDTQSSVDSYISSNASEILDSPQSKYLNDSVFILSSNNSTVNNNNTKNYKYVKRSPSEGVESMQNNRVPKVPIRKQMPPKIPPPLIKQTSSTATTGGPITRSRGTPPPPPPPLRSQASLDSAKLFQNVQIMSAFQTNTTPGGPGVPKDCAIPEMHNNRPLPPLKGQNRPPPLTQIHHSKVNQRQDSNISSDSFSFTSSSPGYNSKSMEAPLLQYASKINKSGIRHQDSNDSFSMIVRNNIGVAGGNVPRKSNIRQDSNVSSDSFSQTSSPGYNTKIMEAPLLAHSVKLQSSEYKFHISFFYSIHKISFFVFQFVKDIEVQMKF